MAEEAAVKVKERKTRSVGVITVFSVDEVDGGGEALVKLSDGHKTTTAAIKWVRDNAADHADKKLQVGTMKPAFRLKVETVRKVSSVVTA